MTKAVTVVELLKRKLPVSEVDVKLASLCVCAHIASSSEVDILFVILCICLGTKSTIGV